MTLLNTQTIKPHTRIHQLGLSARDVLVVQSMFRIQLALGERYVFGPSTPNDLVDLLFVNADDPAALAAWALQKAQRPELVAIMVSDHERRPDQQVWVQRPLDARNFTALLDAITSADINRAQGLGLTLSKDAMRVLVVDDSFPARQFMRLKLEEIAASNKMDLSIQFADSGERAIEALRENPFDIVFLDVEMNGMNGFEACAKLKAIRSPRVVMLSGKAMPADFQQGRAAGCDNYLAKPPRDAELRTVLMLTSFKKMTAGALSAGTSSESV